MRTPSTIRFLSPKAILALAACSFVAASAAIAQCSDGWIPGIGDPGVQSNVYDIEPLPDGDFLVAGRFAYAGRPGTGTGGIVRGRFLPNGTVAWSSIGGGVAQGGNTVTGIHLLDGGDFLITGYGTMSNGARLSGLARWSQVSQHWSSDGMSVQENFQGPLNALKLPDGDLLVYGSFRSMGGGPNHPVVRSNSLARYHPESNSWTAVSVGTDGYFGSMVLLPDGDVLIGGTFNSAGGQPWANIVRYSTDDDTWTAVQGGTNGTVSSLHTLLDGDILVTGSFTRAGGIETDRMARYNPITRGWTPLSLQADGGAKSMAVLPDGTVMFGGTFSSIGGVLAAGIARYNPWTDHWTADGGLGTRAGAAYASTMSMLAGGDLAVGGWFERAGGLPALNIARYRPALLPPTIVLQPTPQATCAAGSARFSVTLGWETAFSYQWLKNDIALDPAANPTAATATLVIEDVGPEDLGEYRCVIAHACASTTSEPATLSICRADYACDGFLDFFDYGDFVTALEGGERRADFNLDGFVDFFDYVDFLTAFEAGC